MKKTKTRTSDDRKLLLAVAGFVVAGAAGIALLAGLTAQRESSEAATSARSPAGLARAEKTPDPTPRPVVSVLDPAEPTSPADSPALEATTEFLIDPDLDPWREGLRAFHAGELETAHLYFSADAETRPDRAYTQYMLGLAAWKTGRLDEAVAALERSAALNPESIRTFVNLARVHNDRDEPDRALADAERAIEIDEQSAAALYQKARALFNADRWDEALETLEQVLALDDDAGQAYNLAGLIHLRSGRDVEALNAMREAARRVPDVAYVQNNLGLALERNGFDADAAEAYRVALSLDATHAGAPVSLARVESRLTDAPTAGEPVVETVAFDASPSGSVGDGVVETSDTAKPEPVDVAGVPELE